MLYGGVVEVETDDLPRRPCQVRMEPRARLNVQALEPGIGESDVHHAAAGGDLAQVHESVDERRRREPVYEIELRVVAHGSNGAGSGSSAATRSPSGGATRPRSAASTLENMLRRLYQSNRLPR